MKNQRPKGVLSKSEGKSLTKDQKKKTSLTSALLYLFLLIAIPLFMPQIPFFIRSAEAATIYVDNQLPVDVCYGTYSIANRDCSGSDGNAYKRPQDAADVVEPGDTVYFREGTYYQHEDLRDRAVVMNILRNGTPDNPIIFKNYNNEEVIFSGMRPGRDGHYRVITLGIAPSDQADVSGQGVQNIIIDGLIVEGASSTALGIYGPANRYGAPENPTENVIIRNVIARNNGGSGPTGGIISNGKVVNLVIEYCEAYNNTGTGIWIGGVGKGWQPPETPEDELSAPYYSVIRNCLAYNNIHPTSPGNTDGIGGGGYRVTFENNVAFGNSDDGMDGGGIEATIKNNIVFNHYGEGNGAGIKFSVGGGGRHTVAGNVVFNNKGPSFEGSDPGTKRMEYYPSRIYGNLAYNGGYGFSLGTSYNLTYPGFEKVYLRDNIGLDNGIDIHSVNHLEASFIDSDYNFFSQSDRLTTLQNKGIDLHSLTGDPQLANKEVVIDTNFDPAWTIEEKLEHIRNQVREAFTPLNGSILIDAGIIIDGYHNPNPGDNAGEGKAWYGMAPDIGAYEYTLLPLAVIQNEPKQGYAPLTVSFDGSQSSSPHGDIVSYEWTFGDGATSQEKETSHTYTSPGEYTVTLKVTDIQGYKGKAQTHIVVLKKEKEFGELPPGCYNNVFNPTKGEKALIVVELQKQAHVRLNLYNTRGNKIRELADEQKEAGTHKYYWDGKSGNGDVVGSGLYFVHIQAGDYRNIKKIVVVK